MNVAVIEYGEPEVAPAGQLMVATPFVIATGDPKFALLTLNWIVPVTVDVKFSVALSTTVAPTVTVMGPAESFAATVIVTVCGATLTVCVFEVSGPYAVGSVGMNSTVTWNPLPAFAGAFHDIVWLPVSL